MKKTILLLILAAVLVLSACADPGGEAESTDSATNTQADDVPYQIALDSVGDGECDYAKIRAKTSRGGDVTVTDDASLVNAVNSLIEAMWYTSDVLQITVYSDSKADAELLSALNYESISETDVGSLMTAVTVKYKDISIDAIKALTLAENVSYVNISSVPVATDDAE